MLLRRLLFLAVAFATSGSLVLAAPVAAADWAERTVTFPSVGGGGPGTPILEWTLATATCNGGDWYALGFQSTVGESPGSGTNWTLGTSATFCRLSSNSAVSMWFVPPGGVTVGASYRVEVGWVGQNWDGIDHTLEVYWAQGTYRGAVSRLGSAILTDLHAATATKDSTVDSAAPTGAVGWELRWPRYYSGPLSISVIPLEPINGGDCIGTGALAWGAAGLTGSAGWGDTWISGVAACWTDTTHVVYYQPSDWVGGHKVQLTENYAAPASGAGARVKLEWWSAAGSMGSFFDHTTVMFDITGYWREWVVESPEGSTGVRYTIYAGVYQQQHSIADVDVADPATGTISEVSGTDVITTCEVPEDWWAIWDLAGYLGCELQNLGVRIGAWFAQLNGQIGHVIQEALTALFVPTSIGDQWEAFVEDASGRVPIGWLGEAVGILTAFYDPAIAGAALPMSMVIMGATVVVDQGVTEPIEQFRPALAAVVYLGLAWSVIRLIRSTMGTE